MRIQISTRCKIKSENEKEKKRFLQMTRRGEKTLTFFVMKEAEKKNWISEKSVIRGKEYKLGVDVRFKRKKRKRKYS